jgi:negative regulator of genetic competence, sporulation and motility
MLAEDDVTDSLVEQKANQSAKHDVNENSDEILGGDPVFVRMETLDDCIRMSKALKDVKCNYSKLYKYDEEYYIEIAFINDSKFVAGQIMTISEYAEEIFTFDEGGALIEEHGKPIIAEDAVAVLAKL